jgi:hypothetical protein
MYQTSNSTNPCNPRKPLTSFGAVLRFECGIWKDYSKPGFVKTYINNGYTGAIYNKRIYNEHDINTKPALRSSVVEVEIKSSGEYSRN